MHSLRKHITVFEHQALRLNQIIKEVTFDKDMLEAFQKHYGAKGVPYYSLIHNGIQFNKYVGVIQVGSTLIEVLPKSDKTDSDEKKWRNILIGMLKAVGNFEIKTTSESRLKIKPNTILDVYFEMFVSEVEYLLHNGLVKKYRKKEANVTSLKGSLQFSKQIKQNLTHQERFYVRHTTYDVEHTLHFILYKTIKLLKQINTNTDLHSRLGALMLNFPEMPDIKVTEATFEKINYNRKTNAYRKGIEIARLLLLQYHPDVSKGRNNVLALIFNMDMLWEQFVYVSLRKHKEDRQVLAQKRKSFWTPNKGYNSTMKPDIWVKNENTNPKQSFILDTKWKNLGTDNPTPEDLRQLYVYHVYYEAQKVALVYPGEDKHDKKGTYVKAFNSDSEKICGIVNIQVPTVSDGSKISIKDWQKSIALKLNNWFE